MVELVDNSNLLDVKSGILCHQVNCVGVMGAGIALQIKGKWPEVFKQYKDKCDLCSEEPRKLLGGVQDILVSHNLVVANCFGQVYPGRNGTMTDYDAWDKILDNLKDLSNFFSLELHFPYMIGCGLAGGDWNIILGKIQGRFMSMSSRVFIHRL